MYTRDEYRYCPKCKKKQKFTRCPNCKGSGDKQMSNCGWRCGDGYWCSAGLTSKWHR